MLSGYCTRGRVRVHLGDDTTPQGPTALDGYIDGYIKACERWMAREVQAMRHSPAFDGMMLFLDHEALLDGVREVGLSALDRSPLA